MFKGPFAFSVRFLSDTPTQLPGERDVLLAPGKYFSTPTVECTGCSETIDPSALCSDLFFPVSEKLIPGTFRFRRKKGLQDRQKRPKTRFQKA